MNTKSKVGPECNTHNMNSSIRKYAFYCLIFIIACFQGYRMGTGDLDTYLPFVYHEYDHSLFEGDLLMETIEVHPVYIWKAMGAMLHVMPAENLFLMAFFIQILIIMAGIVLFYREFFGNNHGLILMLTMMSIAKPSAAMGKYGLNPYEYFHPGAMAFGVLLIVFVLWNKKRWIAGGCLGGLMFLFHPFTGVAMGLAYAFVILQQWNSVHFKKAIIGGTAMVAVASPALIPYFHHFLVKSSVIFDLNAWLEIVRWRMKHSFFISQWVSDRFIHLIVALTVIGTFFRHPAFRKVIPIVIASVVSVVLMAAGEMFSIKMVLQLQLARTSYLIFVILLMFIAQRVTKIEFSKMTAKDILWFVAALFFTVYSFVESNKKSQIAIVLAILVFLLPVSVYLFVHFRKQSLPPVMKRFLTMDSCVVVVLLFSIIATSVTVQKRYAQIGNPFDSSRSSYTDIANWVCDNIPRNETIMSPIYLEGFRGLSLHPIYGTYKDGAPHNYCEGTVFRWLEKMKKFGIDFTVKESSYPQLYHEKAFDIAKSEGIRYVVFERTKSKINSSVLFENGTFAVAKVGD